MIKIENLTKKYLKQTVLDIDSIDIPLGQTFGLIGNNGAGKTTLFSCLLDLIKPTKGKVINNDVDVSKSEDWKSFTTAFLDETFLIGYLMPWDKVSHIFYNSQNLHTRLTKESIIGPKTLASFPKILTLIMH